MCGGKKVKCVQSKFLKQNNPIEVCILLYYTPLSRHFKNNQIEIHTSIETLQKQSNRDSHLYRDTSKTIK